MSSLPASKELAKIDETDLILSSDYNSPSAMAQLILIQSGLKWKQQKQSI